VPVALRAKPAESPLGLCTIHVWRMAEGTGNREVKKGPSSYACVFLIFQKRPCLLLLVVFLLALGSWLSFLLGSWIIVTNSQHGSLFPLGP
jgi:hypothetical protein